MTRLLAALAAAAVALMIGQPAAAQVSILPGWVTPTGNTNDTTNQAITMLMPEDVPIGSVMAVPSAIRSAGGTNNCVDSASNTYGLTRPQVVEGPIAIGIFYSYTTHDLPFGSATGSTLSGCTGTPAVCTLSLGALTGTASVGQNVAGTGLTTPCTIQSGSGTSWSVSGAGCANAGPETVTLQSTVTCNYNSNAGRSAAAVALTNTSNPALDAANGASGASTASGMTVLVPKTGPLNGTADLILAATTTNGTTSNNKDSGFTNLASITTISALRFSYLQVSSNAQVTYAPTWSGTANWAMQIAAFAPAGTTFNSLHTCALLGAGKC